MNKTIYMPALTEYSAGMNSRQYTIRNVPEMLDQALRRRAGKEGLSINETALEALRKGIGLTKEKSHDLDWIAGTWREDETFNEIINEMRTIDEEMWK